MQIEKKNKKKNKNRKSYFFHRRTPFKIYDIVKYDVIDVIDTTIIYPLSEIT